MMDTATEQPNNNTSIKSDGGDNNSNTNSANDGSDTSGTVTSNDAHTGTTSTSTSTGISIKEAMSILTSRANNGGEGAHLSNKAKSDPMLKQMGQTLDLISSQEWTRSQNVSLNGGGDSHGHNCGASTSASPLVLQEREEMAKQYQQQQQQQEEEEQKDETNPASKSSTSTSSSTTSSSKAQIKETLQKQTPYELLQTLFQLQNERVKTFQNFNSGLENTVLKSSGNMTQYPNLVTSTTATFVVLSNSIKDIVRLLEEKGSRSIDGSKGQKQGQEYKDVIKFIKLLQSHEKEKLHLTAALHLELMREQNRELLDIDVGNTNSSTSNSNGGSGDEKIGILLRQSISSLRGKINECIENINDVLEELRYAAAEMSE